MTRLHVIDPRKRLERYFEALIVRLERKTVNDISDPYNDIYVLAALSLSALLGWNSIVRLERATERGGLRIIQQICHLLNG